MHYLSSHIRTNRSEEGVMFLVSRIHLSNFLMLFPLFLLLDRNLTREVYFSVPWHPSLRTWAAGRFWLPDGCKMHHYTCSRKYQMTELYMFIPQRCSEFWLGMHDIYRTDNVLELRLKHFPNLSSVLGINLSPLNCCPLLQIKTPKHVCGVLALSKVCFTFTSVIRPLLKSACNQQEVSQISQTVLAYIYPMYLSA